MTPDQGGPVYDLVDLIDAKLPSWLNWIPGGPKQTQEQVSAPPAPADD